MPEQTWREIQVEALEARVAELEAALLAVLSELMEDSGGLTTPTYIAACRVVEKGKELDG